MTKPQHHDIVVIGAGICGATIANELLARENPFVSLMPQANLQRRAQVMLMQLHTLILEKDRRDYYA